MSSASLGSSSRERIRKGSDVLTLGSPKRRRVDHRPKSAKLLDGIDELVEVNRLDHVGIHAQPVACHQVFFFVRGREDNYGNQLELVIGLDLPQNFQPVYLGQL